MADRFGVASGNWSSTSIWSTESSGDPGASVPANDDTVILNTNHAITVDANTNSVLFDSIAHVGTLIVNATLDCQIAEVGGTITGAGDITASDRIEWHADSSGYTGTLTQDGTSGSPTLITAEDLPAFVVSNSGTSSFKAQNAITVKSFAMTAGGYDEQGYAHSLGGNILFTGGFLEADAVWTMTASANWAGNQFGYRLQRLVIADGVKVTITSTVAGCKALTTGTGDGGVALDGNDINIQPTASNFLIQGTGSIECDDVTIVTGNFNNGEVDLSGISGTITLTANGTDTITLTGAWNLGVRPLVFTGNGSDVAVLDTATFNLTTGPITLGATTAVTASGALDLGTGTHLLGSIVGGNAANQALNVLDFATSVTTIRSGSTVDGALIDGNLCVAQTVVDDGTLNNLTMNNELIHTNWDQFGTGNTNVTEEEAPTTYTLTVNNGTGDGEYEEDEVQEVVADAPATGMEFDVWTGDTAGLTNASSSTTDMTMPASAATITATYVDIDYTLTVNGGTGGGTYNYQDEADIDAAAPATGKAWATWTGDTGGIVDPSVDDTILTMPADNAEITATYSDIDYSLTVTNGTGDGTKHYLDEVGIVADTPATGKEFDVWTGDTAGIDNVDNASATLTMPAADVNVTATYSDIDYSLTVNNGTGDGTKHYLDEVEIVADAPGTGQEFNVWTGDTAGVDNVNNATTTVTMPASNVTVTATFVDIDYTLTVNGGTGGGTYNYQDEADINAANAATGKEWSTWTGDTAGIVDPSIDDTILTMPASNAEITATYTDIDYTLTVTNGSGGGTKNYLDEVNIVAAAPGTGQEFDVWTGDTAGIANVNDADTTLTMPASHTAVTATYVAIDYLLTVNNGTGGGTKHYLDEVGIEATITPGYVFDVWTGDTGGIDNVNNAIATLTMPAANTTVTATETEVTTQYAVDGGGNWSVAATWESAPAEGDATGPPGAGDDVIIDISGTVTADESVVCDSFLLTAGTYIDGSQTHAIGGDILVSGTLTSTGEWTMTADGNVANATYGNRFASLELAAGVTATLTDNCIVTKMVLAAGAAVAQSGSRLLQVDVDSASAWTQTGPNVVALNELQFTVRGGARQLSAVNVSGPTMVRIRSTTTASRTMTMVGDFYIHDSGLVLDTDSIGQYGKLIMGSNDLTCGDITLGYLAENRGGSLDLGSGTHLLGGIVGSNEANRLKNTLDFSTSTTTIRHGSIVDGALIFKNLCVAGTIVDDGTLNNLSMNKELIHTNWDALGTGNTHVTEVMAHPPLAHSGLHHYDKRCYRGHYYRHQKGR